MQLMSQAENMESSSETRVLDGVEQGGLEYVSDEKWVPSSSAHAPPIVTVSEPSGAFCQMDSRFSVPLPPDDVYEIIIDPNNRRVFKNVKVNSRSCNPWCLCHHMEWLFSRNLCNCGGFV